MAVNKRARYEVLTRDKNTCRYCHATDLPLTIDHVVPVALGGTDDPSNLVAACRDCNAGKSSSSPDAATVAQVSEEATRWAAAMKMAAERLAANKVAVDEQLNPWFDEWFIRSSPGWSYRLPDDADQVLTKYVAAGMPVEVLVDAARVACKAPRQIDNRFRYFQGVANNMLRDLQRDAVALMTASETHEEGAASDRDAALGWSNRAWRKGYLKACEHMQRAESGDSHYRDADAVPPSVFQYGALAMVVDASAMDWMATS